jgi:polysaccharide pyruvyl transferase WcaK-like protein
MRLHSIILSEVYNINFIWISYSIKTQEILKKLEKN